jgi:hypothetical protein
MAETTGMGEVGRIGAQKRPGRAVVYTRALAVDRRRYDGRLPMRWLALILAAVLALPASAVAQVEWARDYEQALDAFKKGNDPLAEQKFREARDHKRAPKQSRNANYYSLVYKPFIPDFYLGVIAARTGRYALAQQLLENALANKLVVEADRAEFQLATASLQRARDEQTRLASNVRPDPPTVTPPATATPPKIQQPPPTTTTATPISPVTPTPSSNTGGAVTPTPVRPPPANTDPAWLADFRRAMNASRTSLNQRRYAEARRNLAAATGVPLDAARREEAETLRREIDSAQNVAAAQVVERARQAIRRKDATAAAAEVASLRDLSPGHVAIGELTRGINSLTEGLDRTARLATAERTGVKLFLSGQYKQAADILEQAVNQSLTSPRVHLFLASSRGAQALLAPQDQRQALVDAARKHYALAKPGAGTLTADERFISPSILKLLKSS